MTSTTKRGFRARKLLFVPMILAFVAIKTALVMVLWNHLIPDLFQGPQLDFLHALGLVVLAKLLTGFGRGGPPGFGPFGGHRGHWRRHHFFKERWSKMTPEQREKMRQAMRDRFE